MIIAKFITRCGCEKIIAVEKLSDSIIVALAPKFDKSYSNNFESFPTIEQRKFVLHGVTMKSGIEELVHVYYEV
jgi:hypothetical protein